MPLIDQNLKSDIEKLYNAVDQAEGSTGLHLEYVDDVERFLIESDSLIDSTISQYARQAESLFDNVDTSIVYFRSQYTGIAEKLVEDALQTLDKTVNKLYSEAERSISLAERPLDQIQGVRAVANSDEATYLSTASNEQILSYFEHPDIAKYLAPPESNYDKPISPPIDSIDRPPPPVPPFFDLPRPITGTPSPTASDCFDDSWSFGFSDYIGLTPQEFVRKYNATVSIYRTVPPDQPNPGILWSVGMVNPLTGQTATNYLRTEVIPNWIGVGEELGVGSWRQYLTSQLPSPLEFGYQLGAAQTAFGVCVDQSPPPDYPVSPVTSPPAPPAPDSVCCPPEVVRDDFALTKPMNFYKTVDPSSIGGWCATMNLYLKANTTYTGIIEPESSGINLGDSVVGSIPQVQDERKGRTFKFLYGSEKPVAGSQLEYVLRQGQWIEKAAKEIAADQNPKDVSQSQFAALMAGIGVAAWGESVTGMPLRYLSQKMTYALQYLLPENLPSQSEATTLHVFGKLSDDDFNCITRSLGNIPEYHKMLSDLQKIKPNHNEILTLFKRGLIDPVDLGKRLGEVGLTGKKNVEEFLSLSEVVPPFQDVIRFMVRDTENEEVVKKGRLKDGFTENYSDQLKAWGQANGLSEDVALKYWMAHWELPSPTAANEMLRRLRPGRVSEELETTKEDIERLYAAADYAPGWRDRMMAVSYLTPTRTDIKQGYSRGVYDRREIIELLQDTGLDLKGAETVARLYDFDKRSQRRTFIQKFSSWSPAKVSRWLEKGIMKPDEARDVLKQFEFSEQEQEALIDSALLIFALRMREKCLLGIKRKYMVGAISGPDAVELVNGEMDDKDSAANLVNEWRCERTSRIAEVPARKNVDWAIRGVIDLNTFVFRMSNLGYSSIDIERYQVEIIARIRETQLKAAKKAEQEAFTALRRNLTELRQQKKELEKTIKELEKRRKELEQE